MQSPPNAKSKLPIIEPDLQTQSDMHTGFRLEVGQFYKAVDRLYNRQGWLISKKGLNDKWRTMSLTHDDVFQIAALVKMKFGMLLYAVHAIGQVIFPIEAFESRFV